MHYETDVMSTQPKLSVSDDGRYHTLPDGSAAYTAQFDEVLSFHMVGNDHQVAPVLVNGKAFHINDSGMAIYPYRFDRAFGFYCGLAAVIKGDEWFHITPDGNEAYAQRFVFIGNYQQDVAVVCDAEGFYFHIDKDGSPLYAQKWRYCGDYREGIAVVQDESGRSTHIDSQGQFIHSHWFLDLDVFHKGFARAKSCEGWHHIDKNGQSIYLNRYASVEPFYNGFSRVETHCGALHIINEKGYLVRNLRTSQVDEFASLSADLVGYWRTFTIAAATDLKIFDYLPDTIVNLAKLTNTIEHRLTRLLCGLGELGLVKREGDLWCLLPKAEFLTAFHEMSLATAALEYQGELMHRWRNLTALMQKDVDAKDIFKQVAFDSERTALHHKMLRSYALKDYQPFVSVLAFENDDIVFDAAGGDGVLAELIKDANPATRVILGDLAGVIESSKFSDKLAFDLFDTWPVQANKIMLARVIHDWNDVDALKILKNATDVLATNGAIYVIEMVLDNNRFDGSLCDLHLLTVTGGQERTKKQFERLFDQAGLVIASQIPSQNLVTVMKLVHK